MSEVMCKGAVQLGTACGKCSRCYDAAQAELSALREERDQLIAAQIAKNAEWASLREELAACKTLKTWWAESAETLDDRLTAAEQRNAFLENCIKGCGTKAMREAARNAAPHIEGDALDYILSQVLAALKPTESGASE